MSLDKAMQNLKFDARLIEFNIANGLLKPEELKAYLSQLPDCTNSSEILKLEDGNGHSSEHH